MTPEEQRFLRDFFRSLSDRPLDPDDPAYVGLYEDPALDLVSLDNAARLLRERGDVDGAALLDAEREALADRVAAARRP